jgi:hypothetical protein
MSPWCKKILFITPKICCVTDGPYYIVVLQTVHIILLYYRRSILYYCITDGPYCIVVLQTVHIILLYYRRSILYCCITDGPYCIVVLQTVHIVVLQTVHIILYYETQKYVSEKNLFVNVHKIERSESWEINWRLETFWNNNWCKGLLQTVLISWQVYATPWQVVTELPCCMLEPFVENCWQ